MKIGPIGRIGLIGLMAAISSAAAPATNSFSFTNLAGVVFLNVSPVKTNKTEFVFRRPDRGGFFVEKMTNLPDGVQWKLEAQWREASEAKRGALEKEIEAALKWLGGAEKELDARAEELKKRGNEVNPALWFKLSEDYQAKELEAQKLVFRAEVEWLARVGAIRSRFAQGRVASREESDRIEKDQNRQLKDWRYVRLNEADRHDIFGEATNAVSRKLKTPRTAIFDDASLIVEVRAGEKRVRGTVDSQNGFGALVRSSFVILYDGMGNDARIRYVRITE